jgi:hypothetical protein
MITQAFTLAFVALLAQSNYHPISVYVYNSLKTLIVLLKEVMNLFLIAKSVRSLHNAIQDYHNLLIELSLKIDEIFMTGASH